jgi:hypothetical protein
MVSRSQAAAVRKARVGRMLRDRRVYLGLRQNQLPYGPVEGTVRTYELGKQGDSVQPGTYEKFEKSLGLAPGSMRAAMRGGQFRLLSEDDGLGPVPPQSVLEPASARARADELLRRISDIVQAAEAGIPDPDMTLLWARSARDLANELFGSIAPPEPDLDHEFRALAEYERETNGDPV